MILKISAKRWDEAIEFPCESVTIVEVAPNVVHVTPQPDGGTAQFRIGDMDETIEIIPSEFKPTDEECLAEAERLSLDLSGVKSVHQQRQ